MALKSTIEWTGSTWNPLTGCTKTSPGCSNCYAERLAARLQWMGNPSYINGFKITTHKHILEVPKRWKKPQTIFVNSMSDLFHREVPEEYIHRVFNIMNSAYWHTFQILTKRSERLSDLDKKLEWTPNIWMGVSVENLDYTYRIEHLRGTSATIKFLSLEPLLGPIPDLPLDGMDWVIVGGESGPHARPMDKSWVIDIRDQCVTAHVPFFFKQWGGINKKKAGRDLNDRTWDEMPLQPSFSP